jgi:hypothetical protein
MMFLRDLSYVLASSLLICGIPLTIAQGPTPAPTSMPLTSQTPGPTGGNGSAFDSPQLDSPPLAFLGNNASSFPLPRCGGDCDNASECEAGLRCYRRKEFEPVPGCSGEGEFGKDYCYDPNDGPAPSAFSTPAPTPGNGNSLLDGNGTSFVSPDTNGTSFVSPDTNGTSFVSPDTNGTSFVSPGNGTNGNFSSSPDGNGLVTLGDDKQPTSVYPLPRCAGDCDSAAECEFGLKCFQRRAFEPVPGCAGEGEVSTDYCYDPNDGPAPTMAPGAAFQDSSPSAAPSSFMPTPDPSCSAFSQCAGIPGDCCPAADGVDLFCCGSSDPSCSANPKCAAEGLGDNCCPTSDNVFLDCCEKSFAQCAAYPQCAHMMGDCCPTTSGVMLDCCLTDPALASVAFDSNPESAQCSSFDPCAGLTGDCCPTDAGIFLYCCENVDTACTNHPKCAALGLENACCPTSDGMYLDCCERDFADAASSSACTAQNVTGTVCPDAQGVFADCCVNDLLARSLVFAAASVPTPQSTSGYAPVEPGRYLWSMMMLASLVFVV